VFNALSIYQACGSNAAENIIILKDSIQDERSSTAHMS
jgi:hypothetical protein